MPEQIDVVVSPEITAEELKQLFTAIGSRSGCRACGIQGRDIRLRAEEIVLPELPASVRSVIASSGGAAA